MTNDFLLKRDKMLKTINCDFKESLVVSYDFILKNMRRKKSTMIKNTKNDLQPVIMFDHKLRKHNTNNDNEYFNIEQTEIEKQHEQEDVGIHRADHESMKSIEFKSERTNTAEAIDRNTVDSKGKIVPKGSLKENEIKSELKYQKSMPINPDQDFASIKNIVKSCNKLYDPYLIKRNWPNKKIKKRNKSKMQKLIEL